MRTLLVIGIGAGSPGHLTFDALEAIRACDVFLVLDKGDDKDHLVRARTDLLDLHLGAGTYRTVLVPEVDRDRSPDDYDATVGAWHGSRADRYERALLERTGEDDVVGLLVWGDPSLYDSTLRLLDDLARRATVPFDHRVVPGISAVQLLTAAHRITLNRIGSSVLVTTGRRLAREGFPEGVDDLVVLLDSECTFQAVAAPGVDIWWGAFLGSADELLVAGPVLEVGEQIVRMRAAARARHGWLFDTYLLRRSPPP